MVGIIQVDLVYFSSNSENKRLSYSMLGLVLIAHTGLLLALASYQKPIQLAEEKSMQISLITPESKPEKIEAPKPLPVQPKSAQDPVKPKVTTPPKKPEPQLVANTREITPATAPEQKPEAQTETPQAIEPQQEPVKLSQASPKEEPPIEQPRFNADYLDNPSPAYPALSRKLHEEGRVLLRVHVEVGGQPSQVNIHKSSGFSRLDERAADTVRQWKFVPARQGGQPVAAWVIVPIQFNLKG